MNVYIKPLIAIISIICAIVIFSFITGRLDKNPDVEVSFCELNETDRLTICPEFRQQVELQTGGFITFYFCKTNYYAEFKNLTKESLIIVNDKLNSFNIKLNKVCQTKNSEVYTLSTFKEISI